MLTKNVAKSEGFVGEQNCIIRIRDSSDWLKSSSKKSVSGKRRECCRDLAAVFLILRQQFDVDWGGDDVTGVFEISESYATSSSGGPIGSKIILKIISLALI